MRLTRELMLRSRMMVLVLTLAVIAGSSFAGTIFSTGFETSEGYDVTTKYLIGQPSSGAEWGEIDSNRFLVRDNVTFNGSTGSAWCSSTAVTNTAGANLAFNSDSSVGNKTVWMDYYFRPGTPVASAGFVEVGMYQPGNSTRMFGVTFNEGNGKVMAYNTGGNYSNLSFSAGTWYHVGMAMDMVAGTAKVYVRACADSTDTAALTESDLLLFGVSGGPYTLADVPMNMPSGSAYASKMYMIDYKTGMEANIDNITIADTSFIPEPSTVALMIIGAGAMVRKRLNK